MFQNHQASCHATARCRCQSVQNFKSNILLFFLFTSSFNIELQMRGLKCFPSHRTRQPHKAFNAATTREFLAYQHIISLSPQKPSFLQLHHQPPQKAIHNPTNSSRLARQVQEQTSIIPGSSNFPLGFAISSFCNWITSLWNLRGTLIFKLLPCLFPRLHLHRVVRCLSFTVSHMGRT